MKRHSAFIITALVGSITIGVVGIVVAETQKNNKPQIINSSINNVEEYEKRYDEAFREWVAHGRPSDGWAEIHRLQSLYIAAVNQAAGVQVPKDLPNRVRETDSESKIDETLALYTATKLNITKEYINELDSIIQDQDVERLALISDQMSMLSTVRYHINRARDMLEQVQRYMGIDGSMTEENTDRLTRAIQAAGSAHDTLKRSDVFKSIVSGVKNPGPVSLPAERILQGMQDLQQQYVRYLNALEKVSTTTRNNTQRSLVSPPMLRSPCGYGVSDIDCRVRINSSASTDELRVTVSSFEVIRDDYLRQINDNLTEDLISLQFAGGVSSRTDNTPAYLALGREEQRLKATYRAALEQQRERFLRATDLGMFLTIIEEGAIQELNTKLEGIRKQQQALIEVSSQQFNADVKAGKAKYGDWGGP